MISNCVPLQVRMHASWPWSSRPPSWRENSPSFPPSRLGISLRPTWPSTESDDARHGAHSKVMTLGTALGTALDTALERPDAGYLVGSLSQGAPGTVLSAAPPDGRGSMTCGFFGRRLAATRAPRTHSETRNVRLSDRKVLPLVTGPYLYTRAP
jgi:hypothetical protein